jgi:catechol 2,3-dioxygenase-like lactoylglutathione lyase family enzyme
VAVPPPRVAHAAHLDWIGHAVASLDEGRRLFGDLLDGAETSEGVQDDPILAARWVELEWPEHARIRLFAPKNDASPLAQWLDDGPGRIHHLKLSVEHPEAIADAIDRGDGTWEIPSERNFGVRLYLTAREQMKQEPVSDQQVTHIDLHVPDSHLIPGA